MTEALHGIARKAGPLRSPLLAALAYAEAGVGVLPVAGMGEVHCGCGRHCDNPAKHPLTRHGVRDASIDIAQIRRWWLQWPEANVGIATGARSGLAVVDVDVKSGGRASVAALHADGQKLPPTLTAFTGGGYHLYYRQPGHLTIANTVGRLPNVGPVAGVDVRGDGGYVVAPPSVHVTGVTYSWFPGPPHRMAVLPQWMWPPPPPPTRARPVRPARSEGTSPYGAAALAREVEGVRRLVVGQRNDGLNRAAFSLGMLVGGGELAEDAVFGALLGAAIDIGLSDREAQATIGSGLRAGGAVPRTRPTCRQPVPRSGQRRK